MKYNEMKQAVNLLANEWDLGKKEAGAEGNICAWIYLMDLLEESEQIVTYKSGNKLIGFCGYSKQSSHKKIIKKKGFLMIKIYFNNTLFPALSARFYSSFRR